MNPQPLPASDMQGNRTKIGLLFVAVVFLLAVAYGGYHFFKAASGGSREAITVSDRFLALLQKHDFSGANAMFVPEAQSSKSTTQLEKIQSMIEQAQGENVSYGKPTWQYNVNNGIASVHLVYPLTSAGSNGSISVVVIETPSGWKVYNYNFSL